MVAATPSVETKLPCYDFINGTCFRGARCNYSHVIPAKTTESAELGLGPSPLGAWSSVAVYSWAGAGTGNFKQNAGLSRSGLHHFEVEAQVGRMHRSLSPRQTQFDDFQFMALRMQKKKMIEICEY